MAGRGRVTSTKPLSYQGTLIDGISVRFEGGRIVDAKATRGEEVLNKVLDTDEGARRLGEVALVPHSSPIAQSGTSVLQHALRRKRSLSHRARAVLRFMLCRRRSLSPDQIAAKGGNKSLIHIDWMIGSGEIDIDGVNKDGSVVPVIRRGEWA